MMYGRHEESDQWSSHADFFDDLGDESYEIDRLYREGIAESVEHFQTLVEALESRGELANTLVVFTSDHGELLGEYGGIYGHGVPLVPELLDVPLVFAGAGLPRGKQFDRLLSTIDIAPTALAATGHNTGEAEGYDVWRTEIPQSRVARSELWKQTSYPAIEYRASGVWTDSGGYVKHLNGLTGRLLHLLGVQCYFAPHASIVRKPSRGYRSLVTAYLKGVVTYGDGVAERLVDESLVTDFIEQDCDDEPPEPNREQLRQLGYLE